MYADQEADFLHLQATYMYEQLPSESCVHVVQATESKVNRSLPCRVAPRQCGSHAPPTATL